MASELHPRRFELEFFPSRLLCGYKPFCSDSPEWRSAHMCTWFSASWQLFQYNRKCLFLCIYNPQITISPTSLFSANFNRNRVKNHPKPWTCPLKKKSKSEKQNKQQNTMAYTSVWLNYTQQSFSGHKDIFLVGTSCKHLPTHQCGTEMNNILPFLPNFLEWMYHVGLV